MPALNFKKQFADVVKNGTKTQTIRAERKHPFKVGDKLYLFTGLRTSHSKKLGEAIAKSVYDISITDKYKVELNGKLLTDDELKQISVDDGFFSTKEFFKFFIDTHGLPFHGQLIKW